MDVSQFEERIHARVAQWKERLIDISRRNNLIYFRRTRNLLFIELPSIKNIFEQFTIREKSFGFWYPTLPANSSQLHLLVSTEEEMLDAQEIPNPTPPKTREFKTHLESYQDLQRILRNSYRRSQLDHRERGIRILHLALGMLHWIETESSEQEVRSPLILCPAELSYDRGKDEFTLALADDEEITLNQALQAKLQHDFQLSLPELPEEFVDIDDYFNQIGSMLRNPRWHLEPSVLLGLFSFHKLVMYRDIEQHTDLIVSHHLIRTLVGESLPADLLEKPPSEETLDKIEVPEDSYQILDADSSQRQCIQMAIRGQSFVMHGPPGTGKSQTIANIIAECLARGKTVLFVSEKMAALEVVYKRLQDTHLDEFCLELHSHKASKKEVAQRLDRCLRERLQPRNLPTESDFQRLKYRRDELNQYVLALHQERQPLEQSVFRVFGELAKLHAIPFISLRWRNVTELTPDFLQRWEQRLKQLEPDWYITHEGERFPWYGCLEQEYSLTVAQQWDERLTNAQQKLEQWLSAANAYAECIGTPSPQFIVDIEFLMNLAHFLSQPQVAEPGWFTTNIVVPLPEEAQELFQKTESYWALYRPLVEQYGISFFNLPSGLAQQLKMLWATCYPLFPESMTGAVYLRVKQLLEFFMQTREMLDRCILLVQTWQQQWQGLANEFLSVHRMGELAQLAVLCGTESLRPMSNWLDLIEWKSVSQFVAEIEPYYTEYRQRRNRLLKQYDESLLALPVEELDELIHRFGSFGFIHYSFLWWFFPKLRKDRKLVRRFSLTGTIPPLIHEDLVEARNLLRFYESHIEPRCERATQLLGDYYQGVETDFEVLLETLDRARQILELAQADSIPQSLRQQITVDTPVSQELAEQGQDVLSEIKQWSDFMKDLFIRPALNEIPSLDTIPVDELQGWIDNLQPHLEELRDTLSRVLDASGETANKTIDALITDIQAKEQAEHIHQEFAAQADRLQRLLGERFQGVDTDWQALIAAIEWSQQLINCFGHQQIPEKLIRYACQSGRATEVEEQLFKTDEDFNAIVNELLKCFEAPYPTTLRQNLEKQSLEDLQNYFKQWYERHKELQAWIDFHSIQQQFIEQNLEIFFEQLQEQIESPSELIPAFRKSLLQAWAEHQIQQDERLRNFRTQHHEQLIQEFREIDHKLIEMARQRVIEFCNERRPIEYFSATDSEVGLLRREALKQRRHLPIRRLFDRIPNLLLRLKPCLMMSPISVAQFIDPNLFKFDVVIFDEASQIVPEDAIGAIYRGCQVIVAGDNKQLPPTKFWQKIADDGDADEGVDMVPLESILDEYDTSLPKTPLRWHYRSRYESLIAFSNYRFYYPDNLKLITFPSTQVDDFKKSIQFVYVPDSVYDRGGRRNNPREADVVVDIIFEHFKRFPNLSLGVVTFNSSQMDTIEDEIERRLRRQPEFAPYFNREGLEGFFVKNLENVQGDERDVMLFSIGYGKDSHGRFSMNFGPLNKDGGERRLNVAITRAREKVIVVSSIRYTDMDIQRTNAEGVLSLYHYLRYIELGREALELTHPQGVGPTESPFEENVAAAIRSIGYDAVPQVGCSDYRIDLGVVDPAQPGRFILGVECDGAMYHSAKTARDRDRLRQEVLERMGWRIHRIWSPDWIAQREREIRRLKETIESARTDSPVRINKPQSGSKSTDSPAVEGITVSNSEQRPKLKPYCPLKLEQRFPPVSFHNPGYRQELCQVLIEVVNQEGPIHIELAIRRLMQTWGISRKGRKIEQTTNQIIEYCCRRGTLKQRGDFLWPPIKKTPLPRVPDTKSSDSKRAIEHISSEELGAAMLLIIQSAVGIGIQSLFSETVKLFKFQRVTDGMGPYLQKALDQLQVAGHCHIDGDRVYH